MSGPLDLNDPVAVLLAVARALRAHRLQHAVYGGLALAAYGEPRETKDADLAVAGFEAEQVLDALRVAGFEASLAFAAVRFGGHRVTRFTLFPGGGQTGLNTADLVEPISSRYAREALSRAQQGRLRGEAIGVLTPEDFVLFKVLSTRERDLDDAVSVIRAQGADFDREWVRQEANRLAAEVPDHDTTARLRTALERSSRGGIL
jgi:hypothetical protein